jgi:hypothetical protein
MQAKPGESDEWPANSRPSASWTEGSVHMPSGVSARKTARMLGGFSTAATPPCTTNTSPLIASAAGLAR